jgi:hypothetical protein
MGAEALYSTEMKARALLVDLGLGSPACRDSGPLILDGKSCLAKEEWREGSWGHRGDPCCRGKLPGAGGASCLTVLSLFATVMKQTKPGDSWVSQLRDR